VGNRTASIVKKPALLPWRYGLFLVLCLSALPFAAFLPYYQAIMAGFDVAALGYAATLPSLFRLETDGIRSQAQRVDADKRLLLVITSVVMAAILGSIATELTQPQSPDLSSAALAVGTLLIAWVFSNIVYALHYAHLYYDRSGSQYDRGGIEFPATKTPHYWDFVYFAFTLGMTFQTSDVVIKDSGWRKLVISQCFAAFIFNIGIIAFSINILAG
jgi:uncharacterized membrane protein